MKRLLLVPLALTALLSACGTPACTSETAELHIDYENQFYATTQGVFLSRQRCELEEMDILLTRLGTLDDSPEALGYLQGYLDGISYNASGRLPAYYELLVYAPSQTVPQLLPDGLSDFSKYANARTCFLRALEKNCGSTLLTAPDSPFRAQLPQLQAAFDQLYDPSLISQDWQAEKYAQDLDSFAQLLTEAALLLDPEAVSSLSAPQ